MKLYRFRSCENFGFVEQIIDMGTFYFSDWKRLNDPMEGHFRFWRDDHSEKTIEDIVSAKNEYRVCCFSKRWHDIRMWSHYANNHQGVCIEVTVDESNLGRTNSALIHGDIDYVEKIPALADQDTGDSNVLARKFLSMKLDIWSHEDEYRFFSENGPFRKIGRITKVFLGIQISKQDRLDIIKIAHRKRIPVVRTKIDFHLNRVVEEQRENSAT